MLQLARPGNLVGYIMFCNCRYIAVAQWVERKLRVSVLQLKQQIKNTQQRWQSKHFLEAFPYDSVLD